MSRIAEQVIDQSGDNYNHPARTTLAVMILNAVICAVVGLAIASTLYYWIKAPDGFTWIRYSIIAAITLGLQIGLAAFNSIVMVPAAVRITRRFIQRRYGITIDQAQIEKSEMETESPSKLGPAAVVATATAVALIQQGAPTWAIITLGTVGAALSPVGKHLTNHKDIVTLWRGIRGAYYSVSTKRANKH